MKLIPVLKFTEFLRKQVEIAFQVTKIEANEEVVVVSCYDLKLR